MLTGELRNRIDAVWNAFWAGGIANPLEVIEQITYLLFIRGLDDVQRREENKASMLKTPVERVIFPEGKDGIGKGGGRPYHDLRWSVFKDREPKEMFEIVSEHVFPFLRSMAEEGNLVLFKLIRSKTKFWQILGRGTRLCEDLFGPGLDKECFYVFDYCQNLEFFGQNPALKEAPAGKGLSERLFEARLGLVHELNEWAKQKHLTGMAEDADAFIGENDDPQAPVDDDALKAQTLAVLRDYVAGMNLDNFVVRPHRRAVERFKDEDAWADIGEDARNELLDEVAPLPSERSLGTEPAKRFDLLMLNLQLALLKTSKSFDRYRKQLLLIAAALEEQFSIPVVARQQELILEIQTDPWWDGVTAPLLELVRLRLRDLVQYIDKTKKRLVYTDFEDELGAGTPIELPQIGAVDFNRFKRKARHFLLEHHDNLALQKLRRGRPLTAMDLEQLEHLLLEAGVADRAQIRHASDASRGLGRFIRSLVGLERSAVVERFSEFLDSGATPKQIEFVELVIEQLTDKGAMDPGRLYESPFIDVSAGGPEKLFDLERVQRLVTAIEDVDRSAAV